LFGLLLDTLVPAFPEEVRPAIAEALDMSLVTIVRHPLAEFVRRVLEFADRLKLNGYPIP
jgi:hypothetical protein